ncbi:MAG: hypothetical protein COY38_01150 [Candidatus Aenigmarchaeota archaeon CG_4_10_14_0_8_um_filter_37_24]|nr:hypothetical protein [Candidatus Aenigmarchaeota archaeon]OIN85688.1 MAG: hypothetical protein AUJ50_04700 [Candidatus Aenigmarchaeota archaeon CG1_02_38_14]PIV69425.1 MAG: hypothetical protein COS07_00780 [Candidatus Aenigmarchaeota archaeon CG01_land_8_20_14_3_00_37_9]PIW41468.1 MAG: hypothetical protein COW21_01715 [Candidatus Aenigmarchaeota archaeon CG15_BIG_FIL_POST_REV_8_21_14_020_37_27]PIX50501.1 MAG: hypothetical protein COZ52_03855 [Candidatus Aenigmarchaeota archaeon CG_4_8_14_3_u
MIGLLQSKGYDVTAVEVPEREILDETLRQLKIRIETERLPDMVLIDLNLSRPEQETYNPAAQVQDLLRPYIDSGATKLIPITGLGGSWVRKAKRAGIMNVMDKMDPISDYL